MTGVNCVIHERSVEESVEQIQEDKSLSHVLCTLQLLPKHSLSPSSSMIENL